MTDREKLIALLKGNLPYHSNDVAYWQDERIGALADHLLVNGVTVQRWIPVTERLPEPFVTVIVQMPEERPLPTVDWGFVSKKGEWYANYFDREHGEVTHWMPMPEPPKEGE